VKPAKLTVQRSAFPRGRNPRIPEKAPLGSPGYIPLWRLHQRHLDLQLLTQRGGWSHTRVTRGCTREDIGGGVVVAVQLEADGVITPTPHRDSRTPHDERAPVSILGQQSAEPWLRLCVGVDRQPLKVSTNPPPVATVLFSERLLQSVLFSKNIPVDELCYHWN
jgi:hypothetical protein